MAGADAPYGLGALGVPAAEEALYRAVLARPGATVARLAAATGWDPARVRRRALALERWGLLVRLPGRPARFSPAPPGPALEALALRRREEIERARLVAAALTDGFRPGGRAVVETFGGGPEAVDRFASRLQGTARREVLVLGAPPLSATAVPGVRRRAVYDHAWLDSPERLAAAREAAAGLAERSRVLAEVPLVLLVVDRTTALVRDGGTALVLRPSGLLDGVLALYELLWERAVPLEPATPGADGLSGDDGRLLALSASGLTDRAIARRLGVAQRTVERRMRRIMNVLGARTRFQAGLRAAELTRGTGLSAESPRDAGPPGDHRGA
ncbi:transcriptional regulator TrmB [Streptomyces qinzhouensis]|uniref:Transcriptional regulator TrmB n=2 Tax=Streptomyces qinzhouensis TaxID=2599401 RepID=A0A5B8JMG3_9ACTN|nr:transcriptional regulator TrmB [Streptomyces qinzhouensis]